MISIECFKGLPSAYESFLIEKYGSFITTCSYIRQHYSTYDIHYMLVSENDTLLELLVFGNDGSTSRCFNSLVALDQQIIATCTEKLFEQYPSIRKIYIDASYKAYTLDKSILFFKSDDHILSLPSDIDTFTAELGSKTRKHLRARKAKLSKEFSEVCFVIKSGPEIEEAIVDQIIQFNHNRMKNKGKTSGIDTAYKNNIYQYARHYGTVVYLTLDGVLVAGCIASIINKEIFLHVIAHDNNYSKYNVGEVCVFHTLETAIEKELQTMHFLWGESELKRRFLAKSHPLFSYFIYRKYSSDFVVTKLKVLVSEIWIDFKRSKISDPIRNGILNFRKKIQSQ